jgi:hypothetical protein
VACEELDWILCEAYHTWRFTRLPLAEGAAALVLTRDAGRHAVTTHGGAPFFRQRDAAAAMERALEPLVPHGPIDFLVACENGTFVDSAVAAALKQLHIEPGLPASRPKRAFGEMLAAGSLFNLIVAALRLQKTGTRRALVPAMGFNYQADAALVESETTFNS